MSLSIFFYVLFTYLFIFIYIYNRLVYSCHYRNHFTESVKLRALCAHVSMCLACLRGHVSYVLTCSGSNVPCVLLRSRVITSNNKNKFWMAFYLDFRYFFFISFLSNKNVYKYILVSRPRLPICNLFKKTTIIQQKECSKIIALNYIYSDESNLLKNGLLS